jgi:hypothetical protein
LENETHSQRENDRDGAGIGDVHMVTRSTRRRGGGGAGGAADDDEADDDATPSELLVLLLEEWREVLVKHVLARLDPTDCAMLARVAKPWLAVVLANYLPRAGQGGAVRLKLVDFVGSVQRLAWAKDNGCPWHERNVGAHCRRGRAPGGAAMGGEARLPVGSVDSGC